MNVALLEMALNVTLLIWGQLSFILGICGNAFVLYATIFHNAIKLDKMSIWIIKNLAVMDLCNCIFIVVPVVAVLYSEGAWLFGPGMCYAYGVYIYTFILANAFLINIFTINKLMRCKYPLRNFNCSRRQRVLLSLCAVIFSCSLMIWQIVALSKFDLYVLTEDNKITPLKTCTKEISETSYDASIIITLILAILYDAVPCLTLVFTTTILMVYAIKKTNRPLNKVNILMVILVTISFWLSFLPLMIYAGAHLFPKIISDNLLDRIYEWAWSFTFLSSWTNPIIYLVMNQRLRDFVKITIRVRKFNTRVESC